uniref:Uncharacterized protein n=1 Tax=Rhizophora mucronata TaxID=61149 RepID=A0A2P2NSN2_RHIMU
MNCLFWSSTCCISSLLHELVHWPYGLLWVPLLSLLVSNMLLFLSL